MHPTVFLSLILNLLCSGIWAQSALEPHPLSISSPEEVHVSGQRLERLTETFEQYFENGKLPGGVILLARNGKIFYHESFGKMDIENNTEMRKDAIFRIASQTKAIVSVGIMILEERGQLLISDPVGKYIPEFNETSVAVKSDDNGYEIVPAKRKITIRDLLTHTSGYGYGYGIGAEEWKKAGIQGWYFADREEPILEMVKRMADLPAESHPGEKYVYGYSTDILGALIEVVSGQSLDQFIKNEITDPLGMEDTHFFLPPEKIQRLSTVYGVTQNNIEKAPIEGTMNAQGHYVNGPRKCFSGGAGLLSTSEDYAKFLQMMLNGGKLGNKRIIGRKSVELMTENHIEGIDATDDGTGFGLGFYVVDDLGKLGTVGSETEYGWGGAYHSTYWVDPKENLVVVYFTQLRPTGGIDDHDKLRTLVYQALE